MIPAAHVSVAEVITSVGVLTLEVVEGVTLADSRIDRSGFVNALVRVDGTAFIPKLLVDGFEDTPSKFGVRCVSAKRGSGRVVARCGSADATRNRFEAAGVDILVLVCIGPHILAVLGKNADDILDLILNLPRKLKIVQTDVRRVQRSLFEAHRTHSDAERVNFLTRNIAAATKSSRSGKSGGCGGVHISPKVGVAGVVLIVAGGCVRSMNAVTAGRSPRGERHATRSGRSRRRERTLVNRVRNLSALTVHPLIFGKILEIKVRGND